MKHAFVFATLVSVMVGCTTVPFTSNDPEPHEILAEAGTIALGIYTTKEDDIPDDAERGRLALESADKYLLLMYGYGPLGQKPKYTLASLVHSEVLSDLGDTRLRRMAITARLVMNPDGSLTGISWVDALLMGEQVSPDEAH